MNGDVKSYRLNKPMTWVEFKEMPDDVKIVYVKALRQKYGVSDSKIAQMLCAAQCSFSAEVRRLGIGVGRSAKKERAFDKEGWNMCVNSAVASETTMASSENVTEETPEAKEVKCTLDDSSDFAEACEAAPVCDHTEAAIPGAGCLSFEGSADKALKTVSALLGGQNVRITISWELCENG